MAAWPCRVCAHVPDFAHTLSGRGLLTAHPIRLKVHGSLTVGSAVGFVFSFIKRLQVLQVLLLKLRNAADALVCGSA